MVKANGSSPNCTSGTTTSRPKTLCLLRPNYTAILYLAFQEEDAKPVLQTLTPYRAAHHNLPASATLGIRGQMEVRAHSAYLARTNQHWDLTIALLVLQTLSLSLAAYSTPRVSVQQGIRWQMEVRVQGVWLIHTNQQ